MNRYDTPAGTGLTSLEVLVRSEVLVYSGLNHGQTPAR